MSSDVAPLRILLVDDEDLARNKLRRYLAAMDTEHVIEDAHNGLEALDKIATFAPHMVFLDIQMPGMTGIDVLYHLEDRDFPIIFQTAHDEYAVKAFEENACDYLLKPFSRERFAKAYARALARLAPQTAALETSLVEASRYLLRLSVKHGGMLTMVDVDHVECFVSRDHYTCIYVDKKEYLSDLSLSRLESTLDPAKFIRIHRNALVNVRKVASLSRSGDDLVTMKSGMQTEVSRRNRAKLVKALS